MNCKYCQNLMVVSAKLSTHIKSDCFKCDLTLYIAKSQYEVDLIYFGLNKCYYKKEIKNYVCLDLKYNKTYIREQSSIDVLILEYLLDLSPTNFQNKIQTLLVFQ